MAITPPVRFKTLLDFAHDVLDQSGPVVLRHFRKKISVDNKLGGKGFDPVTAADRGAEKIIAREVTRRFPDHGFIGEEFGIRAGDARYRWIVDPIDGTRAFIMGSPLWGTLLGLLDGTSPLLGIMDQPYTGERFWSAEKASYARNAGGKISKIKTRSCKRLADATVTTTHPDLLAAGFERESFERIAATARMTRYGGDCYSYCLLAAGFVDVVIEAGLKGYDIAALIPIIERAGGRVTTWDGRPATDGGRILATGDAQLHDAILKRLAS